MRRVVIDCFPEAVHRHHGATIVAVDVIRATTTAVTAAAAGHRVFVAASLEQALAIAERVEDATLVGELGGQMPYGFALHNSPASIAQLVEPRRIVLLSTSGTQLAQSAAQEGRAFVASLRNAEATAAALAREEGDVAVIGAGTRGQFREEDQLGCVRVAARLIELGFAPGSDETIALVRRWQEEPVEAIAVSKSVEYLLRTGQLADLDFVLSHVDDVHIAYRVIDGELVAA